MSDLITTKKSDAVADQIANEIVASTDTARKRALKKFGLAAIGAIPWVGGFIAAAIELRENPAKIDNLQKQWLEHHTAKIEKLQDVLIGIAQRLDNFGDDINERIESPEFLDLLTKGLGNGTNPPPKKSRSTFDVFLPMRLHRHYTVTT